MKILYIGTGLHIQPLKTFKDCKEFVFIDSCPINEYGFDYDETIYRKNFMRQLLSEIDKYRFKKVDETIVSKEYDEVKIGVEYLNPTCLTFSNEDRILRYYVSSGLPRYIGIEKIQKDISSCDTLVISGHHPNNCFVKYLPSKINLVYYSKTWIPKTMEELKEEYGSDYDKNIWFNIFDNPDMIRSKKCVKFENY